MEKTPQPKANIPRSSQERTMPKDQGPTTNPSGDFRYTDSGVDTGGTDILPSDPFYPHIPLQEDMVHQTIVVTKYGLQVRRDIDLNSAQGSGGALRFRVITFTSTDATPSVKNANVCITAGTTSITNFDDGSVGQCIIIKATDSITITNGTPIKLAGAANYAMTVDDTLTLCMFTTGVWHELARSVN
jgi:hypothetical protein